MTESSKTQAQIPSEFGNMLLQWWSTNRREFAWRNTRDPYEILIAELLLRRTNAAAAENVYHDFLERYPNLEAFSTGKAQEIEAIVKRLGLAWRAKNVSDLSRHIARNCGGKLPLTVQELTDMPGIGPYVARAVLINSRGLGAVAVDANVVRVVCRVLGLAENDNLRRNKKFQALADSMLGSSPAKSFNYALLDLAALLCKPRNPLCRECPLQTICKSAGKINVS